MFRPAAGFFFEFQPCVDIIFKQPWLRFGEVPNLVDVENFVAFFHTFDEFGGTPGPSDLLLLGGVVADIVSFECGFVHFFFHAGTAQRKCKLVVLA